MKKKPIQLILKMTKYTLYGFLFQMIILNVVLAHKIEAQKIDEVFVSVSFNDTELQNVLTEIEKQSDFHFTIHENEKYLNYKVSVHGANISIENLLKKIGKQTGLSFQQVNYNIGIKEKTVPASNKEATWDTEEKIIVSGTVVDEKGITIPGVNVLEKGTTNGAVTDIDGNYSITVESQSSLVFSSIGFVAQEVELNGRTKLDIVLKADIGQLEEVVVVGYGTQKREALTGAVSSVGTDKLEKSPSANLTNSLAGQAPGLIVNTRSGEPGNDNADILIRGKATLGNTSPLVVIDGIPDRAGGFARLNPSDIESISILKDASAAIYGARAANGVIVITTKRGDSGDPRLSFSTNFGFTQPTRVPNLLDSYKYAIASNEYNELVGQMPRWSDEDLEKFKNGTDPLTHPNTDWWASVMKNWTLQQNHNVSLSGGSDKVKYFVSGQYLRQEGNYKEGGTYYNQAQTRVNLDINATEKFKIGVDISYRNEYRNGTAPSYDANGLYRELYLAYPWLVYEYPNGLDGVDIGGGPRSLKRITSPEMGYQHTNTNYLLTKTSFDWDLSAITEGLYSIGYYSYDISDNKYKAFEKTPPPAYMYNPTTGEYDEIVSLTPPSLLERRDNSVEQLFHLRLGYTKDFGLHNIDAFAAIEQYKGEFDGISASRINFLSNNLDQLFAGGQNVADKDNNSSIKQNGRTNFISRISYGYDNRIFIDYNMRYDGSQNFPKGDRFGFFPGVSVGWRISQEDFFSSSVVNELKIKGSWGQMGNDAVSSFQYLQTYLFGNGYFFGPDAGQTPSFELGPTPNTNITWEVATSSNIGIESRFFQGALGVNVDLFRSGRTGILIPRNASVPEYSGLTLPDENLGEVVNKGVELEAFFNKKLGNGLSYNLGGNFTYAKNKVVFMDEAPDIPDYQRKTGFPIDSYLIYQSNGLYQNEGEIADTPHPMNSGPGDIRYIDVNGDGQINALDQVRQSRSRTPEIMYGVTLGASYANFDLNILLQGQARAKALLMPGGLNMAEEFFDGRWQKEGDNHYPRTFNGETGRTFGVNTYASDFWLRNSAFMRLKNVEIGYNFPEGLVQRLKMQSLRVYCNGNNLLSIDQFGPSFDPETPSDIGGWYYPQQRIVNIGLNVTF
ncbi:TonB-dependent receptor [Echinicola sp. 20G]|uniref:SusC/RagA family TonB-linked outer membrane protein n=1 Tax=Echinicola sp. 20G TaxID=2781961 RepID=UPI001910CB4D|nr:TonB-dependent receptor [Echinicola sp. 20G]